LTRAAQHIVVRECTVGAAVGALTGLLIGLSVSDVVASILAGLVALLGAFFGLKPQGVDGEPPQGYGWRMVAFALVCAAAVLAGIALRTHSWLSEPVERQIAALQRAGFTPEQARSVALYQRFGLVPKGIEAVEGQRVWRGGATALFAGSSDECTQLAERRFANERERTAAFTRAGGPWKVMADSASSLEAGQRAALLQAAWTLACESPKLPP
jgi:hypothetical protein